MVGSSLRPDGRATSPQLGLNGAAHVVDLETISKKTSCSDNRTVPTMAQIAWLRRGLTAPGLKLPLFDRSGRGVPARLIEVCLKMKWAEPWFSNPLKPDWLVCRLTEQGRAAAMMRPERRLMTQHRSRFGR